VVVGVSGGPDSVALWHLLCQLPEEVRPRLHLVHVDHGWRPEAAFREADVCRALAQRAEAGSSIVHLPPPRRRNEDEARTLRLGVLRRVAESVGAAAVALAHQRDDQAETVLMQLLRGSAHAVGMPAWRPPFWRPLLGVPRAALLEVCRGADLEYSIDATNLGREFQRNRLRADVLPLLAQENPHVTAALARFAALRREDDMELQRSAELVLGSLPALPAGVDLRPVRALGPAIGRRVLWTLATRRGVALGSERVEAGLRALYSGRREQLSGGVWIECGAMWWHEQIPDAVAVPFGGRVRFGRLWVGFGPPPADALATTIGEGTTIVRGRLRGDRLRTRSGSRKLQDILVDAKVARPLRDRVPVVTLDGRPVWLPGGPAGLEETRGRTLWMVPAAVVRSIWSVLK